MKYKEQTRPGDCPRGAFKGKRNCRGLVLAAALLLMALLCCGCHNPFLLEDMEPELDAAVEEAEEDLASPQSGGGVTEGDGEGDLSAFTICLDPGHGITSESKQEAVSPLSSETKPAYVSGAVGNSQTEEELNLAVVEKLKAKLEAKGASVIMTRTTHEATVSNIERAEMANEAGADLCVRIHADGSENPAIHGISVLVPAGSLLAAPEITGPSRAAAQSVHDAMIETTGAEDHGLVERTDLTGFNWSKVPVILVEMGFLSNAGEDAKMATEEYREALAEGMFRGIRDWLLTK